MSLFGPPNVEKMKDKRDVEGLVKALGYKEDVRVREAAARALLEIGTPGVEPLNAALRDGDETVRRMAAEALGKIGHGRALSSR
jgi:HEAT repeat protein